MQLRAHRAGADHDQFQFRFDGLHGFEGAQHQRQILLGRDAADINDCQIVIVNQAPLPAQFPAALARMKQGSVHSARNHLQVLITLLRQRVAQLIGGNQRGVGAVVQVAQMGGNGLLQPAEAVVLAVTVKIGMEIAADRDAKFACGGQG